MDLLGISVARASRTPALRDTDCGVPGQDRLVVARDHLAREVFGIMGVPVDLTSLSKVIAELKLAAEGKAPFVLSTPNLNFLVLSQHDSSFRESLLMSDLCPADGVAVVWLGRLLGAPLPTRIAGSDIFEAIKRDQSTDRPMRLFLFGGAEGLSYRVAQKINASATGMKCVGALSPGFGSVEEMSRPELLAEINASSADFIAAFLGAKKGQEWLSRNHFRLSIPIRSHLGATINYQAGTVKRAPRLWQAMGLEWLWRIKEEPYLWHRYMSDGVALSRILLLSVLPSAIYEFVRCTKKRHGELFKISFGTETGHTYVTVRGPAIAKNIEHIRSCFRQVSVLQNDVIVDVSQATRIDSRIFGLLIMLRKLQRENGFRLAVVCRDRWLRRIIEMRGFGYLLEDDSHSSREQ